MLSDDEKRANVSQTSTQAIIKINGNKKRFDTDDLRLVPYFAAKLDRWLAVEYNINDSSTSSIDSNHQTTIAIDLSPKNNNVNLTDSKDSEMQANDCLILFGLKDIHWLIHTLKSPECVNIVQKSKLVTITSIPEDVPIDNLLSLCHACQYFALIPSNLLNMHQFIERYLNNCTCGADVIAKFIKKIHNISNTKEEKEEMDAESRRFKLLLTHFDLNSNVVYQMLNTCETLEQAYININETQKCTQLLIKYFNKIKDECIAHIVKRNNNDHDYNNKDNNESKELDDNENDIVVQDINNISSIKISWPFDERSKYQPILIIETIYSDYWFKIDGYRAGPTANVYNNNHKNNGRQRSANFKNSVSEIVFGWNCFKRLIELKLYYSKNRNKNKFLNGKFDSIIDHSLQLAFQRFDKYYKGSRSASIVILNDLLLFYYAHCDNVYLNQKLNDNNCNQFWSIISKNWQEIGQKPNIILVKMVYLWDKISIKDRKYCIETILSNRKEFEKLVGMKYDCQLNVNANVMRNNNGNQNIDVQEQSNINVNINSNSLNVPAVRTGDASAGEKILVGKGMFARDQFDTSDATIDVNWRNRLWYCKQLCKLRYKYCFQIMQQLRFEWSEVNMDQQQSVEMQTNYKEYSNIIANFV